MLRTFEGFGEHIKDTEGFGEAKFNNIFQFKHTKVKILTTKSTRISFFLSKSNKPEFDLV